MPNNTKLALTKEEIADRIKKLNAMAEGPYIDTGDWRELMLFLADVLQVPDGLIYAPDDAKKVEVK